jgi:transposase-like protein
MGPPAFRTRGGIDYPRNRVEFDEFFPDEQTCLRYLEELRWLKGFACPGCGRSGAPWRSSRGMLICPHCRKHASVLAGTLFHRTRTPLRAWFLAAWEITSRSYGANALGLQRVLGLGSYQTAWSWLHKFRRAMVHPGHDRLNGSIEAGESYLGGERAGVSGRHTLKEAIVAIAVESNGGKIGRVRLRWSSREAPSKRMGGVATKALPTAASTTRSRCSPPLPIPPMCSYPLCAA